MYVSLRNRPGPAEGASGVRRRRIPPAVLLLGATSMFTDISSEMVTAVLPIFLTLQLGLTPAQFGLVDGLYHGVSAVSRLGSGIVSDRFGRPKAVASIGYGLSAATRPLLLAASSVVAVASLVSLDRIGKGIRTAPRDAMISQASHPDSLARNFGVHRALDNLGAMLGPLLAFAILMLVPGHFDAVFVVSSAFAILGLAVLVLLVPARLQPADRPGTDGSEKPVGARQPKLTGADLARLVRSRPFVRRVAVAGLLTVFTVSDAFIFLTLLEHDADLARVFPLFAVGLALAYAVLAVPIGRLADRYGRMRVFLLGHIAVLAVYAIVAGSSLAAPGVVLALLLMGLFYAATDGVLAASVSAILPDVSLASGLALAQSVVALAAFTSSVAFGLLLGLLGQGTAFAVMAAGLTVCLIGAAASARWSDAAAAG